MLEPQDLDAFDGICFIVSMDGRIDSVGPRNWNSFAPENGAPDLLDCNVTGRNMLSFISGEQLKYNLSRVLTRVSSGVYDKWVMPYRCMPLPLAQANAA